MILKTTNVTSSTVGLERVSAAKNTSAPTARTPTTVATYSGLVQSDWNVSEGTCDGTVVGYRGSPQEDWCRISPTATVVAPSPQVREHTDDEYAVDDLPRSRP